ncbi:transcription factor [Halobacterium salinarum]|uniref:TATA-box-binding protein n=1 Tax=Halobacterium salinarum TaxID=2242 RepID=UPI0025525B6A|nr:transcription factor [Halobacterium salinarum]MDL0135669.1 transcription factor [Halobacterium salinarum]MDL0138420.1 transcription factor [Halobacterium salinarum]
MSELSIASIVATGKIDREFELEALGDDIDAFSCDYSPDEHPGLYVKFHQDGPTITIFTSGSFNIRGASSKKELYNNRSLIENSISTLGIEETISGFQITNIVFTSGLEENINPNELAIKLGLEDVEYEPEQFPGLVYRLNQGVILIFSSGRLVLTGFTNIEDAKQAFDRLSNDLIDD